MKVLVKLAGVRRALTYEAPEGTVLGDAVMVPPFGNEHPDDPPRRGQVIAAEPFGEMYDGPVTKVLEVLPREVLAGTGADVEEQVRTGQGFLTEPGPRWPGERDPFEGAGLEDVPARPPERLGGPGVVPLGPAAQDPPP